MILHCCGERFLLESCSETKVTRAPAPIVEISSKNPEQHLSTVQRCQCSWKGMAMYRIIQTFYDKAAILVWKIQKAWQAPTKCFTTDGNLSTKRSYQACGKHKYLLLFLLASLSVCCENVADKTSALCHCAFVGLMSKWNYYREFNIYFQVLNNFYSSTRLHHLSVSLSVAYIIWKSAPPHSSCKA